MNPPHDHPYAFQPTEYTSGDLMHRVRRTGALDWVAERLRKTQGTWPWEPIEADGRPVYYATANDAMAAIILAMEAEKAP